MSKNIFLSFVLAGASFCALAASTQGQSGSPVVVEVDGVKLTAADFEQKRAGVLFQAKNTYFAAQRRALDEFVDEYLLERQAQKENLTVEQLLEKHVNSKATKEPSEETLRTVYDASPIQEPFESVRGKMIESFRQGQITRRKSAYIQELKANAKVAIRLEPPRIPVAMKDTPVRGNPNAPVMILEYADFECPYCQQAKPIMDKLLAEYKNEVAYAYKDLPLPMHPKAPKAAEASHCAGEQGKYWEYHDALYTTKQLELPQLKETARNLKLDGKAFDQCLDSGKFAARVQSHAAEAQALKIEGTPAFLINGRYFGGGLTYEQLKVVVAEELLAKDRTVASK